MLREGSKSFYGASRLLPSRVRPAAIALYAFCRTADDAVDDPSLVGKSERSIAVAVLGKRLDRVYNARKPEGAVERAFSRVAHEHGIPRALPDALLDGMAWDADDRETPDLASLEAYAARVAGAVGAMMTLVMGARSKEALARACDLGVAMQLTNVARDVGADARLRRMYLPTTWLADEGLSRDEALALALRGPADPRLRRTTARLLRRAELLYARAETGIGLLPKDCRAAIWGARLVYAEIGRVVASNGYDSVSTRAVVSTGKKLLLLAEGRARALVPSRASGDGPLDATRYLVDAVTLERERAA